MASTTQLLWTSQDATPLHLEEETSTSSFEICYEELRVAEYDAELLRLNNEVSKDLIKDIEEQDLKYQIALPGDHQTAIRDFKAHFIAVRSCTDPSYPANTWDHLIPHVIHTLNMLRTSKIHPKVSAHTMMKVHHNCNSHPTSTTRLQCSDPRQEKQTQGMGKSWNR